MQNQTQQNQASERQILSVSQLNQAAKNLLDTYLPLMWVEGEISNFSTPSSGHWYFTLKDAKAQVRCAMFKGRNLRVNFKPKSGDKVVLRAKASLYEGRGDYQLIAEHMEPDGFGDLQRQFDALKAKLQSEGLFDENAKQIIPKWPKKLGVITSSSGAAIHDILHVLKRRFPSLPVVILPVAVQGEAAAGQIADAIATANQHSICDVLLLTRGGGAMEDLWAFNEEVVARAMHLCQIPIISAVGHEVDFTIADFVADLRAPTPSAAAELISANQEDLQLTLAQFHKTLKQLIRNHLKHTNQQLKNTRARLRHPGQILDTQAQALDQLEIRMKQAISARLKHHKHALWNTSKRMAQASPSKYLEHKRQTLTLFRKRLTLSVKRLLEKKSQQLTTSANLLHGVSPLNTLNRGYSIILNENEEVVTKASSMTKGDKFKARLSEGSLYCEVLESTK